MSDWTYCEDGTPKKEGEYITTCYDKSRDMAYATTLYYGRVGNRLAWSEETDPGDWEENKDVIAWMPVPRPYKHDEPGWTLFSDSEPTEEGRYFLTCFKKTTGKFMVETEYSNMYNYKHDVYEKKFEIFANWHLKEMPELIAWMPFPDPCPLKVEKLDSSFEVVPSVIFRESGLYNVVIDGNVIAVSRVGSALPLDKEER